MLRRLHATHIERRQIHLVNQVADVVDEVVWRQLLGGYSGPATAFDRDRRINGWWPCIYSW